MPELPEYYAMVTHCTHFVGRRIDEVVHVPRKKSTGELMIPKGNNILLNEGLSLGEYNVTCEDIGHRGAEFYLQFSLDQPEKQIHRSILINLSLGSCFVSTRKENLMDPPFSISDPESRTNFYITFHDLSDILVLLDCKQYRNHPTWKLFNSPISLIDGSRWLGGFDCLSSREQWLESLYRYVQEQDVSTWSWAKLLTDKRIFNGLGRYLSSEILHRAQIQPWKLCGKISMEKDNLFTRLISVTEVTIQHCIALYNRTYDPTTYNTGKNSDFIVRYLECYRKPGSFVWEFKGVGTRVRIHTLFQDSPPPEMLDKQGEKWMKCNLTRLTRDSLGVGIHAWHSKKDVQQGVKITKSIEPSSPIDNELKRKRRNRPNPRRRLKAKREEQGKLLRLEYENGVSGTKE